MDPMRHLIHISWVWPPQTHRHTDIQKHQDLHATSVHYSHAAFSTVNADRQRGSATCAVLMLLICSGSKIPRLSVLSTRIMHDLDKVVHAQVLHSHRRPLLYRECD